jgi:TonB-dependent SusC/RagA subfamily outer membrane receptor
MNKQSTQIEKILFTLILLISWQPADLQAQQEAISLESVQDSILVQLAHYPQEKIHLHLDRNIYVPGEKIWFKAYVVDALTHIPESKSRFVYVELISPQDSLIQRVKIRPDKQNLLHGHLFLSDLIPEGRYTLRAYTRYMQNLGEDYFYRKEIYIGRLNREDDETNKKKKKQKDDYDVSFFPEGGSLMTGEFCRVAFKALHEDGYPEEITGKIINRRGEEIVDVKTIHAGMGSFPLNPQKDDEYYLTCTNTNGLEKRFQLPKATPNGYGLGLAVQKTQLILSLKKSAGAPEIPLYILAHCRGAVFYFAASDWTTRNMIFKNENIPSGLIQFLLLDEQLNPLSERLAFNKNDEPLQTLFTTDKNIYQTREKVSVTLSVENHEKEPQASHLSIAITDDTDLEIDSASTLPATLLLSSELKGSIETPAYYLQNHNQARYALDHLMMTHGWRRYHIPDALKGKMQKPEIPVETSQEIYGNVKSLLAGKPVENSEIVLYTSNGDIATAQANEKGNFLFTDFEFADSVKYLINALGKKGKSNVELTIREETFPTPKHLPGKPQDPAKQEEIDDFYKKAEQRAKYDEDMRTVQLDEVTVTAKRTPKKDEARLKFWANAGSDATVYREDIEKRRMTSLMTLLSVIGGVRVEGSYAYIRSSSSPALVIVDGLMIEDTGIAPLKTIDIDDVEAVDVFKGASASVFGLRGGNGVISITTKRGGDADFRRNKRFNFAAFQLLGHQQPIEFYAPKYDTPAAKNLTQPDFRTTLFWKPDLITTNSTNASFDFYTSDYPATYSVVIEGITSDGKTIHQVEKIQVKKN